MNQVTSTKISQLQKLLVPNKIEILKLLQEKETCVCQLVKCTGLKHNLMSHHLKTLVDFGYIESNRTGKHIAYRINESKRQDIESLLDIVY